MQERPTTLGALRAAGYRSRPVKEELRANLIERLRAGGPLFPGVIGYERTVVPQLQNALLAKHDFLLLGLRGQAKTRLLRSLALLLDEAVPAVAGSPLNEDPLRPLLASTRRRIEEEGDDLPIEWVARADRYREKLATPDVSIADLIGDLDPIKAASRGLALDDPEVIHYGILPRTNRGIFAINELPDLQARIQVGLLNILEEGDVQIRGFPVRLPLDVCLVFSANPEDYTNRGSIITPLRDRIASQIHTHYPRTLEESLTITRQEAWTGRGAVDVHLAPWLEEVVDEVAFRARESELVDQNSGVSARLAIALREVVESNAERRALITGADRAVVRAADVFSGLSAITGKLELVYEGEREGPRRVAELLVGQAVRHVFDQRVPKAALPQAASDGDDTELHPTVAWFAGDRVIDLEDDLADEDLYARLTEVPGLEGVAGKYLDPDGEAEAAAAMEFVLEALHQHALLAKAERVGGHVFGDPFQDVVASFNS